jgi:hypothetical protein
MRVRKRLLGVLALVSLLCAAQCTAGATGHAVAPTVGEGAPSICQGEHDLGLDYAATASKPVLIEEEGGLALGELGMEGAYQLEDDLLQLETFCSLAVSQTTQAVLDRVQDLVEEGNSQGAHDLLDDLLASLTAAAPSGGRLAMRLQQDARQQMIDFLAAAQLESQLGLGDGEGFFNAARAAFQDMAGQELESGGLHDALRVAQEALVLGEDGIFEDAMERAREALREDIDAALEDFDPCLPNPEIVKEDIRNLLRKLEASVLLGDSSSASLAQWEAGWRAIAQAAQIHFADTNLPDLIPDEYKDQPANCCRAGEIEVQQATFTGYAETSIAYHVENLQGDSVVTGQGSLEYQESLGSKVYLYTAQISIEGTCVQSGTGRQLELRITIDGDVTVTSGGEGGWPLDDVHEIILPLEEGANEQIIREGIPYRIFTLHLVQ